MLQGYLVMSISYLRYTYAPSLFGLDAQLDCWKGRYVGSTDLWEGRRRSNKQRAFIIYDNDVTLPNMFKRI